MSNLERRKRIDELKERLFFEIKDKGLGGGGSSYGAPDIPSYNAPAPAPSYNAPAPAQKPPSYNAPAPSYGAPSPPSYGQFDGFNFNKGPGKIIEIPVPDLPIPDPIEFKAGVLRSKGRIASGLLHTKAGLLRAGANILAQKANALDKFAQAIPAIKANLINSLKGFGKGGGGGGGGYGAPPAPSYNAPAPQQPPQSYNAPAPQQSPQSFNNPVQIATQQPPQTFNNNIQPVSQSFRPSNGDSYGSPVAGVISNNNNGDSYGNPVGGVISDSVANVPVGSTLSFGSSSSGVDPGLGPRLNPITQSTFDQSSPPKRNVLPGQVTTITLNDLQQLRQNNEQLVLRETRQQVRYQQISLS